MQRYLNGLCLAYKEKKPKIIILVKIQWKKMKKNNSRVPLLSHHCRNQRQLVTCAVTTGRTLQCHSVQPMNHDPDQGLPKQVFVHHHLLWQLFSSREGVEQLGEQPSALSCKRTEHPVPPLPPDVGCIHQVITLWKPRGLFACVKSLGWKNKRLFSKSANRSNACKL